LLGETADTDALGVISIPDVAWVLDRWQAP